MIVIGAGLSGLIAASMLRGDVSVFEAQSALPNNHSALLRFRSSVVGDAVGIPFRKVSVMKSVQPWRNAVADALAYSIKCTGTATLRSSISAAGQVEQRYIAPPDLAARMAANIGAHKFAFDVKVDKQTIQIRREPVISTMPMPALMAMLGWKTEMAFRSVPGYTVTVDIPEWMSVDACATVYLPSPNVVPYRVSLTERRLIIEVARHRMPDEGKGNAPDHRIPDAQKEQILEEAFEALGLENWLSLAKIAAIAEVKPMRYAKILPVDEHERKSFIMWASEKFGIYSLGRFATWRPKLLLDDIVNDVRVIQRMANGDKSHKYSTIKAAV